MPVCSLCSYRGSGEGGIEIVLKSMADQWHQQIRVGLTGEIAVECSSTLLNEDRKDTLAENLARAARVSDQIALA